MSKFQWYEIIAEEGLFGFPKGDKINANIICENGSGDFNGKPINKTSVNLIDPLLKELLRDGGKIKKCMSPKEDADKADPDSIFSQDIKAPTFPTEEELKAKEYFKSPDLILKIHEELSKTHLLDDDIKLTAFIVCCTAYLNESEQHKSIALKGSSSVGKDNLIKTTLSHIPLGDALFLTNATQSTMEDDTANYRIIAYSEVNLQRDDKGANSHLLEIIKQLSEGGTSSLKKDVKTGFKTTYHAKQEQKTIIYGTTEAEDDEELATRFIVGSVEANEDKIKAVNNNTFDWFGGIRPIKNQSWIAWGLNTLKNDRVILPYSPLLKDHGFFDCSDPRSMRDVKRVLSCASAIAWLYQDQREKDTEGRILSDPFDLLSAIIITGKFFNHTYQGLGDQRLQHFIDAMNIYCETNNTEIFPRHKIQETLGCSIGGVKRLSRGCQELSIIRFHHTENSIVYYERCQKGVKRVLMGVKWNEILTYFEGVKGVKITQNVMSTLEMLDKICNNGIGDTKKDSVSGKFDTLDLTPPWSEWDDNHITFLHCVVCGATRCNFGLNGKPYCYGCGKWANLPKEEWVGEGKNDR